MENNVIPFLKFKPKSLLLLCLLFFFEAAQAQVTFDDDVDDEQPTAPINGFIALGLAAGACYGIKKIKHQK